MQPNCELTGYEIEFEREDNNQVALVSKEVSDRFHEVKSSDLPAGSGKVSFMVSHFSIHSLCPFSALIPCNIMLTPVVSRSYLVSP